MFFYIMYAFFIIIIIVQDIVHYNLRKEYNKDISAWKNECSEISNNYNIELAKSGNKISELKMRLRSANSILKMIKRITIDKDCTMNEYNKYIKLLKDYEAKDDL